MPHAVRTDKRPHVGIQFVPLQVVGQRCTPAGQYFIDVRTRREEFLLAVGVVHAQRCRVAVHVVGVIVSIFCQQPRTETLSHALVQIGLQERVVVGLTLAAPPHIVHDGTGDAALRMIRVCLQVPAAVVNQSIHVGLGAHRPYVAVMACGRGIVGHGAVLVQATVAEIVFTARRDKLRIHRRAYHSRQPLLPKRGKTEMVARGIFRLYLQVPVAPLGKLRPACLDIHRTGIAELRSRLEDGTLLSVVERYLIHIVHRELSQVHLSVLRIAQLDPIVEDAHMVAAHRTDVHRLDAPHSAIVLQLQAGKIAQGVGNVMRIQAFQFLPFHGVRGNHLAVSQVLGNNHLADMLDAVECRLAARLRLCCRKDYHKAHQCRNGNASHHT